MNRGNRRPLLSGGPRCTEGGGRENPDYQQDLLAHLADHLLEMRDLAERGQLADLSRLLDRAYEEAFVQLCTRAGSVGSVG